VGIERFWALLRERIRDFFTNWQGSDLPVLPRIGLTLRNRTRAFLSREQCCGHPGQPGC
jgi:hypothetical protein